MTDRRCKHNNAFETNWYDVSTTLCELYTSAIFSIKYFRDQFIFKQYSISQNSQQKFDRQFSTIFHDKRKTYESVEIKIAFKLKTIKLTEIIELVCRALRYDEEFTGIKKCNINKTRVR